MDLPEYLNTYFSGGDQGIFEDKPIGLVNHFLEKFGVDVRKENDLYQFKYNLILAKWSMPLTHECRGAILRHSGTWEYVSRPFSKFFNFHEGLCKIGEEDFAPTLQIIEKADGTCIQAWYDDVQQKWRCSTLGTISTQSYDQAFRPNDTFENLFLKTAKIPSWDSFHKTCTYIFELCTHDNRIVTQYPEDVVYLIAAREKHYGQYLTDQSVDDFCLELMEAGANIKRPDLKFFYTLGFTSFKDVLAWVEIQAENPSFGKFPEGFVIYRGGIPVAKMKNAKYLAAFHVSGGNKGHAKNQIIELVFQNKLDDVYATMIPELQQFADTIKQRVANLGSEVIKAGIEIMKGNYPTQKDYALAIQNKVVNKQLHAFFYSNKEQVLAGQNLSDLYTAWIKDYYKRFLDLWKEKEEA